MTNTLLHILELGLLTIDTKICRFFLFLKVENFVNAKEGFIKFVVT